MRLLTKETSLAFLDEVNYFEGANVNSVNINLTSENSSVCTRDSISIEAQLECSDTLVRLEMRDLVKYRLTDLTGISLFGLSGDPHSLAMAWSDYSVVVAIGVCVDEIHYENLIASDLFVESKAVHVSN